MGTQHITNWERERETLAIEELVRPYLHRRTQVCHSVYQLVVIQVKNQSAKLTSHDGCGTITWTKTDHITTQLWGIMTDRRQWRPTQLSIHTWPERHVPLTAAQWPTSAYSTPPRTLDYRQLMVLENYRPNGYHSKIQIYTILLQNKIPIMSFDAKWNFV